jgi:transcriptional regulator with XRE-family HTH domain
MTNNVKYEDWRARKLEDPEIREALAELEAAYIVARLRMERGLTQEELAERIGTHQSSIARLESGKVQPRLSFLRRVIRALGAFLELRIIFEEDVEEEAFIESAVSDHSESPEGEWQERLEIDFNTLPVYPPIANIRNDTLQESYLL